MKFYWSMPEGLKNYYQQELENYKTAISKSDFQLAWRHLERAHIIGQPWFVQHTRVHWLMLMFGIKIKNGKEILGQLPRLLVGGVKSFVGIIPVGNTGGANVPPLKKMEIPVEIEMIMKPFVAKKILPKNNNLKFCYTKTRCFKQGSFYSSRT